MASGIDRRRFALGSAGLIASANALAAADNSDAPLEANVLRVLFEPPRPDSTRRRSATSTRIGSHSHIFEALLRLRPAGGSRAPAAADGRGDAGGFGRLHASGRCACSAGILLRRRPGVQGQAARARRGRLRVRVQAHLRPGIKSPAYSTLAEEGILGLEEIRARALRDKKPFDYDSVAEGLRALDRYTLRFKLAKPRPRFATTLAASTCAAVAREVVEAYGDDLMAHPVGTGPTG